MLYTKTTTVNSSSDNNDDDESNFTPCMILQNQNNIKFRRTNDEER